MKKIQQVDSETGEILEGAVLGLFYPKRQNQNGFGKRWFAMSQDALDALCQFTRLEDYRVLMALLKRLDYENLILANQAEIARDLGMQRQNVQRAIKRLIGYGALLEGPKAGRSGSYRLNPNFGWKGTAGNHKSALRAHPSGLSVIDGGRD